MTTLLYVGSYLLVARWASADENEQKMHPMIIKKIFVTTLCGELKKNPMFFSSCFRRTKREEFHFCVAYTKVRMQDIYSGRRLAGICHGNRVLVTWFTGEPVYEFGESQVGRFCFCKYLGFWQSVLAHMICRWKLGEVSMTVVMYPIQQRWRQGQRIHTKAREDDRV